MHTFRSVAWDQPHVREARQSTGRWHVEFARTGRYRFSLTRWPREANATINDIPAPVSANMSTNHPVGTPDSIAVNERHGASGMTIPCNVVSAQLTLQGRSQTAQMHIDTDAVVFEQEVTRQVTDFDAVLITAEGVRFGAWYVYVEYLGA